MLMLLCEYECLFACFLKQFMPPVSRLRLLGKELKIGFTGRNHAMFENRFREHSWIVSDAEHDARRVGTNLHREKSL